jgi:hypothetical protein
MPMTCKQCGKTVAENLANCSNCGAPLSPQAAVPLAPLSPQKRGERKTRFLFGEMPPKRNTTAIAGQLAAPVSVPQPSPQPVRSATGTAGPRKITALVQPVATERQPSAKVIKVERREPEQEDAGKEKRIRCLSCKTAFLPELGPQGEVCHNCGWDNRTQSRFCKKCKAPYTIQHEGHFEQSMGLMVLIQVIYFMKRQRGGIATDVLMALAVTCGFAAASCLLGGLTIRWMCWMCHKSPADALLGTEEKKVVRARRVVFLVVAAVCTVITVYLSTLIFG